MHSSTDVQSHDWHLQRAHATLANSVITSSDVRLLFLDANEFLILPSKAAEGCLLGASSSSTEQIILTAWEVTIPITEGTGMMPIHATILYRMICCVGGDGWNYQGLGSCSIVLCSSQAMVRKPKEGETWHVLVHATKLGTKD